MNVNLTAAYRKVPVSNGTDLKDYISNFGSGIEYNKRVVGHLGSAVPSSVPCRG